MAGLNILHAQYRDDVARLAGINFLTSVGVHFDDTADTLRLAGISVEHGSALFDTA